MDEAGVWLSLAEASRRTGRSVDALRAQVKRGDLGSRKDNKGRVMVHIAAGQTPTDPPLVEHDAAELSALREELAEARAEASRAQGELSGLREAFDLTRQRLVAAEAQLDEARTPLLLRVIRAWRGR